MTTPLDILPKPETLDFGNIVKASFIPVPSWHEFFLRHVYLAASKSKDRKTKIGAILVRDNTVVSEGFNGFPRKVNDNIDARHERPAKYSWSIHGEANCVFNAARNGIKTLDCILYTSVMPCSGCAGAIIQAGIKQIIIHKQAHDFLIETQGTDGSRKWIASLSCSIEMFKESGVEVNFLDLTLGVRAFINERIIEL